MVSQITGYIGQINPGNGINYSIGSTVYGECNTAAATAAKTVDMTGFTLIKGATIYVKFINANTASSPTLNVQGTGAKPIISNDTSTQYWPAGTLLELTYNDENWITNNLITYNIAASDLSSSSTISTPIVSYNNNKLEYNEYVLYLRKPTIIDSSTSPAVLHYATGLKILGSLTGNNDNLNVSGQRGVFSINLPGPQIRFGYINDVESNQGALIYTNNNISSNGKNENSFGGSSFHFVADGEKPTKLVAGGYTSIDGIKSSVTLLNLLSIEGTSTSTTGNTIISTLTTDRREEAFIRYYLPAVTTTYSGGIATTSSMQNSRFVFAQRSPKSLTNTSTTASNEMSWEFYRLPITTSDLQSSLTYEILTSKIPANEEVLGGIKIGYAQTGQNYPIELDNNNLAYVNVPWIDTTYVFDSNYNASSNRAATMASITNEINKLDVSNITGFGAGKTLSALSETDGKISAHFLNIEITKSQVSDFPSSMPASDVSAWAKAANKPSYSLSEITSASDVLAIEALTGTSGFLKKTAANKWELDTTTYVTSSGVTSITLKAGTGISLDTDNTAITTSGTRTISLANNYGDTKNPYDTKNKNLVLATPSNTSGVPSFRALVENDIPQLNASKINAGTLDFDRLPTMYWANVAISDTSATNTTPTFKDIIFNKVTSSSTHTPHLYVNSTNLLVLGDFTGTTAYYVFNSTQFRPASYVEGELDLGSSSYKWKDLYLKGNIVAANTTLSGTLNVTGATTLSDNVTVDGSLTANELMINGTSLFNNSLIVSGVSLFNSGVNNGLTVNNGYLILKPYSSSYNIENSTTAAAKIYYIAKNSNYEDTIFTYSKLKVSTISATTANFTNLPTIGTGNNEKSLLEALGLSNALHFIGIATTTAITNGSTANPNIENYDFTNKKQSGDVILGKSDGREYVWTGSKWELLGYSASTVISSGTSNNAANIGIIGISQATDGSITATTGNLVLSISSIWTAATTTGPILSITVNNVNTTATIPIASKTQSGVITTTNLTFAGNKTFNDNVIFNGTISSSIIPTTNNNVSLGSETNSWSSIYSYNNFRLRTFTATNAIANGWNLYGRLYVNVIGSSTTAGSTRLILGNPGDGTLSENNDENNSQGFIFLYSKGKKYVVISNLNTTTNTNVYIPNYNGNMHLTHTSNANSLGSNTLPVYVAENGRLTEGTQYAGGTNVTLNGTPKSGNTIEIYTPTTAGISGLILVSNGSGAPQWSNTTSLSDYKYWANIESTSAATYNTEPEIKSIKITGNTSANTAATNGVVLQYDATLKVLNFVFA